MFQGWLYENFEQTWNMATQKKNMGQILKGLEFSRNTLGEDDTCQILEGEEFLRQRNVFKGGQSRWKFFTVRCL